MSRAIPPRLLSAMERIYRMLLFLYPGEHRREYSSLMVQAFRDLCRDAYLKDGDIGLLRLWMRVLVDLATTAVKEHVHALRQKGATKMENRSFDPLPWGKVALAVLPGALLVVTRSGLLKEVGGWHIGRRIDQMLNSPASVAILALIVVVGWIVERRLPVWSFIASGMLLLLAPGPAFHLLSQLGNPRSWLLSVFPPYFLLGGLAAMAAFAAYRTQKRASLDVPHLGWLLLALCILLSAASSLLIPYSGFGLGWQLFLLLPIVIGLPLARRNGILAGLIAIGFEFVLVEGILDPTYHVDFYAYWNPSLLRARASAIISYLPALFFLVVTPIWVLRARSTRSRVLGFLLPPFIALVTTTAIEGIALRGTPVEFTASSWVSHSIQAPQFAVPLALAALMYHWVEGQGPALRTEGNILSEELAT